MKKMIYIYIYIWRYSRNFKGFGHKFSDHFYPSEPRSWSNHCSPRPEGSYRHHSGSLDKHVDPMPSTSTADPRSWALSVSRGSLHSQPSEGRSRSLRQSVRPSLCNSMCHSSEACHREQIAAHAQKATAQSDSSARSFVAARQCPNMPSQNHCTADDATW